jgi:hypothetical protein
MKDNTDANYLLLNRAKNEALIYMNSYKTLANYGKVTFKLSTETAALIKMLRPDVLTKTALFKTKKLGPFINKMLKAIDLFKDVTGMGTRYFRHSLVSTKLMALDNKNEAQYVKEAAQIADLAMHSGKTQKNYISPLIDAKGDLIYKEDVLKAKQQAMSNIADGMVTRGKAKKIASL